MEKIRQNILDSLEKIPAFPHSVHQIQKLTSDINCDPAELVRVIEHDPVLVLKILKMINSAYFGLSRKITSVNHAIIYIGLNTVKNLSLGIAAIGVMPRRNEAGFNMDFFLVHSLATATISRMLAQKTGVSERDAFAYFLPGLLHDFGKIVLAHSLPKEYKETLRMAKEEAVPLYEVEKHVLGVSHATVGSLLVEKWQMPDNLKETLNNHHDYSADNSRVGQYVMTADQISKELNIGYSGDNVIEPVPQEVLSQFGGDINHIIESLGNVREEVEKALIFIN